MCTETATSLPSIKFKVCLSSHEMSVQTLTFHGLTNILCADYVLQNKIGFCLGIQLVHLQLQLEAF